MRPCSGKTTVIAAIREEYGEQIVIVPEAATMLLSAGFPMAGKDLDFCQEWQDAFQAAIIQVQRQTEIAFGLIAKKQKAKALICDRGCLDGAAYTPVAACRNFVGDTNLISKKHWASITG